MATVRARWWTGAAAAACIVLLVRALYADPPKLSGETPRTAQRFAEAAELEKQKRWADVVDLYLRLLDDAGDDLVSADGEPQHLLPARGLMHRRIASRPELLAPYRARVEPQAKRLLEQGQAERDPQLLEKLVDQFFCSRSADIALQLLGDLSCERGRFAEARHYWRLLCPAAAPGDLAYPDPVGGPALPRAKSILARLLAGERAEATVELQRFRNEHPEATGHLAGRDGKLAAILNDLLADAEMVRVPTPTGIAAAPTTFAGDATRNDVLAGVLPPFCPQPRYAPIPLFDIVEQRHGAPPGPIPAVALGYYPVIARGHVFIADSHHVLAYDVATGALKGRFDLLEHRARPPAWAAERPPLGAGGDFTLSVDGDRIYARLGPPYMRPVRGEAINSLVCLHWRPEQATPEERLRPRWALPAAKPDAEAPASWEGTPIVRDGRLYAAITRIDGARTVTAIACYSANDPSTGPIWQKDVYEATIETTDRTSPRLLTLAGANVVLSSDAGVIVALDARTGRRAWAIRYPSVNNLNRRGPAPCVFAGGRLYAAPSDADRIFCLDAGTGAPLWTSDPVVVAHLLGVTGDRVVVTLGGFQAGLCAFDAATGHRLPQWGYRIAGAETLAPFGRGLLCTDRVYWPTRAAGLHELRWDGTTGYPPTAFRELPGGNLAYGDGCLVVATADHLHVLIGEPADAAAPGRRVGQESPDRRHDRLLWRADLLIRSGRAAAEIRAELDSAAGAEFSPERRFLAIMRRAEFEQSAGNLQDVQTLARTVADSPDLSCIALRDADGRLWSAKKWAASATVERPPLSPSTFQSKHRTNGESPLAYFDPPAELRLPLEETWRVSIDRGHEWELLPDHDPDAGRLFVAGKTWLACRNVGDGAERWRQELSFAPAWLAIANGSLIVGGDNGCARLNAADGRLTWQFRVSNTRPWFDRPGWRDPDATDPAECLSGFRWACGRMFARLGAKMLIALDGGMGELLWQQSAPFAASFHPAYFADDQGVVAQSDDGRRWVFAAADGHVLNVGPAPREPWIGPPVALDERRLLVVEDGRLVALDRSTWKPAWTWEIPRPFSLTGELAQVRLINGVLLVGVPRNDCFEIEQLDPTTGTAMSPEGIAIGRERVDLAAVTIDGHMLYVAAEGELKSIDGRKGRIVARKPLIRDTHWRIESLAKDLLLWTPPTESPTEVPQIGGVELVSSAGPERQRNPFSLALGLGSGNRLRNVRINGNDLVIVTDSDVRGYRGAKREVK